MTKHSLQLKPLAAALATLILGTATAQADVSEAISEAVKASEVKLGFRYRYEGVDEDNALKNAQANTLRSRLTVKTGAFYDFVAIAEVDNVASIGKQRYNDASGTGDPGYSVVADPEGTDLNQAVIKYVGFEQATLSAGRQRINHDNQRFLGGVGWRQNEQTYDAVRAEWTPLDAFKLDYSYLANVNRIFGPTGPKSDLRSNSHALLGSYDFASLGKLTGYGYYFDFDNAAAASNLTYGLHYAVSTKLGEGVGVGFNAAYAQQKDAADNPLSYSADYYSVDGSVSFSGLTLLVGQELLGSDGGVKGFQTPLATLHKFNGFADRFLGTPADGLQDTFVKLSGKYGKFVALVAYHEFKSDYGSRKLGKELDLMAKYTINKHWGVLAKYADYDADTHSVDTEKLWLQITAGF